MTTPAAVPALRVARSELVLGGQRSGKSRRAEALAEAWLAADPRHQVVVVATAQAWDDEMQVRIDRHRADRSLRLPRATTVEEPLRLAETLAAQCQPDTLLLVDCLTLWLSNLQMQTQPNNESNTGFYQQMQGQAAMLSIAIGQAAGPLVLVSNEIGLGVVPMGREVRAYVDALGWLNQRVAEVCERVTLMAAGLPLQLKGAP